MGQTKWLVRNYKPSDVGEQMQERDRLYGESSDEWLSAMIRGAYKTFTSEEIKTCILTHLHYLHGTEREQAIFEKMTFVAIDILTERLLKIEDIVNGNFLDPIKED